jgi:hypothetical protein
MSNALVTTAHNRFIGVNDGRSIPALLSNYTDFGALGLTARFFGTSGHLQPPAEGAVAGFNKCARADFF